MVTRTIGVKVKRFEGQRNSRIRWECLNTHRLSALDLKTNFSRPRSGCSNTFEMLQVEGGTTQD